MVQRYFTQKVFNNADKRNNNTTAYSTPEHPPEFSTGGSDKFFPGTSTMLCNLVSQVTGIFT